MTPATNYDEMLQRLLADKEHQASVVRLEQHKLQKIDEAIAAISGILNIDASAKTNTDTSFDSNHNQTSDHAASDSEQLPDLTLEIACCRKSIADAAIAILALVAKPTSEADILAYLVRGKLPFSTDDKLGALRGSLWRKAKDTDGVRQISPGIWGLTLWKETINPDQIGFGSIKSRDKAAHADATMKGLQAAREEGRKGGRTPRITVEHAPLILQRLRERWSIAKVADEFGMTSVGMGKAIQRLRDEGHLPQKLSSIYETSNAPTSFRAGDPLSEKDVKNAPAG